MNTETVDISIFEDNNKEVLARMMSDELIEIIDSYLNKFDKDTEAPEIVARAGEVEVAKWIVSNSKWNEEEINRCLYVSMDLKMYDLSEVLLKSMYENVLHLYQPILISRVLDADVAAVDLLMWYASFGNEDINAAISNTYDVDILNLILDRASDGYTIFGITLLRFVIQGNMEFVRLICERQGIWPEYILTVCLETAELDKDDDMIDMIHSLRDNLQQ